MNNQEFFDAAVAHLRRQNAKSRSHEGTCLYEADNGHRCAVGGTMSPDLLSLVKETKRNSTRFTELAEEMDSVSEFYHGVDRNLIQRMQEVHDCSPIDLWEQRFAAVAAQCMVTYTPPAKQGVPT